MAMCVMFSFYILPLQLHTICPVSNPNHFSMTLSYGSWMDNLGERICHCYRIIPFHKTVSNVNMNYIFSFNQFDFPS